MARIRGFASLPKRYQGNVGKAVESLFELGLDVYSFNGHMRRGRVILSDAQGLLFNGELEKIISSQDVMKLFFGTSSPQSEIGLDYDISDPCEVMPIFVTKKPEEYHALRFAVPTEIEALNVVTRLNLLVDYTVSSFRFAEPGVVVYETFDGEDLDKVRFEFWDSYIPEEDIVIKGLKFI